MTCGIGVQYNGLVSLPVSFFSAFLTAATGKAAAYTHRVPLLLIGEMQHHIFLSCRHFLCFSIAGTIGDIVSYSIIAFWPVNPEQKFMFFLITLIAAIPASVWDVCVGCEYKTLVSNKIFIREMRYGSSCSNAWIPVSGVNVGCLL